MSEAKRINRRNLLTFGTAGIGMALLNACKTKRIHTPDVQLVQPDDESEQKGPELFSYNRKSDISELPDITKQKNLQTEIICYGTIKRAMVVINLPAYYVPPEGGIDKVTLFLANGDPVAEKKILGGDVTLANILRPIVFENLNLKSLDSLIVVYSLKDEDESQYKYVSEKIRFSDTYKTLPVRESYGKFASYRPLLDFGLRAVTEFGANDPNWAHCQALPGKDGTYTFQCDDKAVVLGASGLKGYEICDIMNRTIMDTSSGQAIEGQNFVNLLDYPMFICYKIDQSVYYRSIIRLF